MSIVLQATRTCDPIHAFNMGSEFNSHTPNLDVVIFAGIVCPVAFVVAVILARVYCVINARKKISQQSKLKHNNIILLCKLRYG